MTIRSFFYLSTLFILASCGGNTQAVMQEGLNYFGAEIDESDAVNVEAAMQVLASQDTADMKIVGTISSVCQTKGCWMTLTNENVEEPVFIKFKDYAFFVPKNSAGKKAILQGKLYNNITPVDELRHYAEDKGESAEEIAKITEPKKELSMMASGVIIYN